MALPNCSFPTIQIHDLPKTNRHMIEEELAPVYTNAPEETPSPELPQMPIAGGIGEEFGYAPLVEEARVAQQKELDVNAKLHEVNVENKRRELSAIKGGMMEREDHSPEEKAVAVQNWITKSSGRLPKSHTEMRFGMDKLWKRAGKEGLAPSYDAVFDVVKERFVADKMEADEEQKYFEAGAKSKFSPDKYSWSQSIAQQDIDPDRLKILKAAYNQGAEAQTERYSPAMVNKINEYMEAANSVKTTEKVDKDVSPLRDKDFLDKKELDTTYDDIIDDMVSYTKNMSSEDKGLFVAGLRERIAADPDKNTQASDFFSQFGLNMKRSGKRGGDVFVRQGNWLKNLFHEANVNASEIYAPYVPYGQLMHSYFEQEYKDQLHKTNMKSQLSEMLFEEYDPIQPLARKDTMLGLLEEGILYQSPQVAASIVVPLVAAWATAGASAWVQVAGGAVSLSSLLTQSASEISESQRKGYLHSGMGFDEASEKSRGLLNRVWAVPHAAIGMLQVKTFTRKIPYWDKVVSRMDATIRNRALRFGSKAAATATAETIEEWTQDAWTETLKELSHAIDGEMDSPEWFGEGAFFDDFWAKSIVTFSSLGGLSMASAAGGLNMEDRASAWAELPPLLRQAAGHQLKDIEALDNAKSPQEKVKAYIDAEKNKDGQSPQVAEAITRLEETAASQALEIQDAQNKGLFPKSEVEMLDGKPNIKVFDPETNDIIIETDSFVDATAASFDWWGKKEEDFKDEFIYVKSMFEAATMLSQQAPELVQRLSLGEQMTDTRFKEQGADAARSIAEEAKRNEMINGGDGSMARLIFGTNQVQREGGQTRIINGLFQGATVETLLHEAGHGFFKKGISDGTIDFDDTVKLLKRVDKAFQGRFTKAIKFKGSERPAESMRLLPDTDKPTFKMVDEGMAQLYSALILGEGKLAPYRKLLNDSMSAHARSAGKSTIANFISAMRYYFNLALSRAVAIKGMVRRGEIDQKDLDKVRAWMQGTSLQEEITGEAKKEAQTMLDGMEDVAFSTSPAFYSKMEDVLDKKIQGKQATPEQIKAIIDPSKGSGVKAEEIKWTGIEQKVDELAAENNGKVPKAELMEWLKNDAAIKFEEVVKEEINEYQIQQDLEDVLVEYDLYSDTGMDGELQFYSNADTEGYSPLGYDELPSEVVEVAEAYSRMTEGSNAGASFAEYQLPNGENYKETVLTMPFKNEFNNFHSELTEKYDSSKPLLPQLSKDERSRYDQLSEAPSTSYTSSHFPDIPNYVAHMRTNERQDSTGGDGLFIEEIQSDLHQAARKVGYREKDVDKMELAKQHYESIKEEGDKSWGDLSKDEKRFISTQLPKVDEGIPDAPFRKDWSLQMFKRGLRDAVATGKDWIGWTTGETQNERYDLSKQVDYLLTKKNDDGSYQISAQTQGRGTIIGASIKESELESQVGKEVASKIINGKGVDTNLGGNSASQPRDVWKKLEGNDLKVGGSGMKGFYDNMLPNTVGKYVKQWGAKVEDGSVVTDATYDQAAEDLLADLEDRDADTVSKTKTTKIHKVTITDAMRESVDELGQTSFSAAVVRHKRIKESEMFQDKIKSGDIVVDQSLEAFEGKSVLLHQPDTASAGVTEIDDEVIVNGKGGVYYPVMFSDLGLFWASTKSAAEGMAKSLNEISRRNGGKILMALTSAPIDKLFSSTTMSNGAINFFNKLSKEPRRYGITKKVLNDAIVNAGNLKIEKVDGKGKVKVIEFKKKLKKSSGLETNIETMRKSLKPEESSFAARLEFVRSLASSIANHMAIPSMGDIKKMSEKERKAVQLKTQQAINIASIIAGDNNEFAKKNIYKGKLSTASIMQGLGDLFSEPLVKTFQQIEKGQGGRIYAVLEMDGEVEAVESDAHESYPSAVRSTSGKSPKVHVLEKSNIWHDVVINNDTKEDIPTNKRDSYYPPSVGVSSLNLEIKKPDEGVETIDLSFSQGWQPEIRESILTNVESRMSTPQMKAEVIGDIQRRVQKLINDRRSFEKGMVVGDKTAKGEAKRIRSMIVTYEAILLALPTDIRGKMGSIVTIVDPNSEKQVLEFFDKKLDKLEKVVDRWVYGKFNVSRDRLFKRALAKPKAGEKDKGKLVGEMGAVINKNFEAAKEAMDLSEAEVDGKVAEIDKIIESKLAAGTLTTDLENELESKKNLIDMFGNWKNLTNSDREAALKFGWREFEYAYLMSTIEKARRREELAMKADELIKATGIPMEDIEKEADKRREGMGSLFGRIKAARYGFYDFEQVMSSVFPDAKQVVDKVIQEQQADAQFHDRMKEHQEGVERFFGTLVGDSFLSMKALKLQDKMQTVFFKVEGGGIKRELTQMQMIQARLMWRQEDGRRHMENWADEEKGQTNYSQEFMDALEGEMIPESKSLENYLISQYELEYDRLNAVYERMYGVSLPKNLFYSPLTVDPLQDISDKAVADPLSGQDISMMGSYNPSLLRRSKTAAAKPAFRDALATFYAHKNQIEYWMAYAEFVRELRSIIGNRDVRDAVKAKGGEEAVDMLKKWVNALDAGGLKSSALASQLNSFIGRSVNRTSSAILAGRLSTLAIQSTQAGAALAQMPTKDYVWRMGKLLSGNLEFAEAFNSKFIQRRLREAPPAVKMAMQGMASGSPTIAKAAAQKLGTLISGADAFFTAGTYAIIYDYLTTKKGMESTEAHTEATRLTEQVAQPTRMARRSMVELQQSQIALSKLSWAFASETRQKIALSAYRWDSKFTLAEKTRAIAVTFGFGGVFAQIVRSVGADLRDDDDDEIFDEKYWNPARMALKALLDPLTGVPIYGDLLQSTIMGAAKVAGVDTGYIFDNDSMISSVKDFPKAIVNLYGTASDLITGDDEIEIERLVKDVDKVFITMSPFFDTPAALSSFSHLVRDLFMIGKNAID